MSKVPLHTYEKAKRRQRTWDRVAMTVLWLFGLSIGSGALYLIWQVVSVAMTTMPALWVPIGAVLALGVMWTALYFSEKNGKVVKEAEYRGVIDE